MESAGETIDPDRPTISMVLGKAALTVSVEYIKYIKYEIVTLEKCSYCPTYLYLYLFMALGS